MLAGVLGEESLLAWSGQPSALFIDPDLFPLATLGVPGFLLIEGKVDADDVVYGSFITIDSFGLFPSLLVDTDVIYDFTKSASLALAPALYADADAFYSLRISSRILGPSLFVDDDIFGGIKKLQQGRATINQSTTVDTVFDFDIFYSAIIGFPDRAIIRRQYALPASVAFGSITPPTSIIPGRGVVIAEVGTPGAPPLAYLSPNLFNPGDTIFTTTAFSGLQPTLVPDTDAFYSPSAGNFLRPLPFADVDNVLAANVGRQLRPIMLVDGDLFLGPAVGTPGRLGLVTDDDLIFAAAIKIAPLAPGLVASDDVVLAPVIGAPPLGPIDPIVDFADTFFAPAVLADQRLTPHLWVDVDIVLTTERTLAPDNVITDADAFLAPSITVGATPLQTRVLGAARAGIGSGVIGDDGSGKTQVISNIGVMG
jgi:hypothetical protein